MRPSFQLVPGGRRGRGFVKSDGGGLLRDLDLIMLLKSSSRYTRLLIAESC